MSEDHERNVYRSEAQKDNPRYKDEEFLREMYVERKKSMNEIADKIDCAANTVRKYLKEYGIEIRSWTEAQYVVNGTENHVPYNVWKDGYCVWRCGAGQLFVHRLVAIAEFGFDAVCDKDVHHKNGIPWDNRPENLELTVQSEHNSKHRKLCWLDDLRITEMYDEGASSYDLAPVFDITPSAVIDSVKRVDPSIVRNRGGAKS